MSNTTARDLPQVAATVDPAVRQPLTRVIEETQRLLGFRGDPLDAAITERRAREIGLTDGEGRALTGNVTYNNTYPTLGDGAPDTEPDLTPPPTPTGFGGTAGFSFVNLEWDNPGYTQGHGHGQTNVYGVQRSPPGSGTLPVFGDAQIVHVEYGTSPLTSMPSELNTRWHLWIKWQSVDGVESVAAAGGINGLVLDTAQDVTQLLDVLTDQITASELDQSLLTPINTSYLAAGTVTTHFWGFDGSLNGWFTQGAAPTATLTSGASAATFTALGPDPQFVSPALGVLGSNGYLIRARIRRVSVTSGAWAGNCYYQTPGHPWSFSYVKTVAAPADLSAWNVVEWDMSALTLGGTDWMTSTILDFRLDFAETGDSVWEIDWISVERPATAPLSGALLVESQTRATETGGLLLQWSVKTDINGYIAGFGFASTLNNATPSSQFIIRSDRFVVAPPINFSQESEPTTSTIGHLWRRTSTGEIRTWDGDSWEPFTANLPFVVQATATTEGGVAIPAGTYIDAAYIKGLTAVYARIQTLVADDITAADISATQITGGTMQVGSFIQSTNYTSGPSGLGWRINADGTAFLQAAYIRGQLVASQIDTRGLTIQDLGGTVIFAAGTPLQPAYAATTLQNSYVPTGSNLIYNSAFEAGLDGWTAGGGISVNIGVNLSADWQLSGGGAWSSVLWMQQVGSLSNPALYYEHYARPIPVTPNQRYVLSGYLQMHRCTGAIFVRGYNVAGALVQDGAAGVSSPSNQQADGRYLSRYARLQAAFTAQSDVVHVVVFVRKYDTDSGADSFLFGTRFQLEEASASSGASAWTDSARQHTITAANVSTYIANVAIGTAQVADLTVTNAKIADLAVTNAKISDLAVTTAKIADLSVDTLKLAGESVNIPRWAFSAGRIASVSITIPAGKGGASCVILGSISAPNPVFVQFLTIETGGVTTTLRNETVTGGTIPALNYAITLAAGTYVITVFSNDLAAFNAFVYAQYTMK